MDSRTRRLSTVVDVVGEPSLAPPAQEDTGLADVMTLQRRAAAVADAEDEKALFQDTLAEYGWARDVAGVTPQSLAHVLSAVAEVCRFYDVVPWRLNSRLLDEYFAGPGKRSHATVRKKITHINGYFAFLEQRNRGEIARRFGIRVESPVDPFNRPRHRGDFTLRAGPDDRRVALAVLDERIGVPGSPGPLLKPGDVRTHEGSERRADHHSQDCAEDELRNVHPPSIEPRRRSTPLPREDTPVLA